MDGRYRHCYLQLDIDGIGVEHALDVRNLDRRKAMARRSAGLINRWKAMISWWDARMGRRWDSFLDAVPLRQAAPADPRESCRPQPKESRRPSESSDVCRSARSGRRLLERRLTHHLRHLRRCWHAVGPGDSIPKRFTHPDRTPCVAGPSIMKSAAAAPRGTIFGRMPEYAELERAVW